MSDEKKRLRVERELHEKDFSTITIRGEKEDIVRLAGALQYGMKWIRMRPDGEIETSDVYTTPPVPIADPGMRNIWQLDPLPEGASVQMKLFYDDPEMQEPKRDWSKKHRSIYLQSIQGYDGQDAYVSRAKRLAEAGFVCLRSCRGDDGKYWEIWYLSGPCCGRGPLKDMKTADEIKEWVLNTIGPGTVTLSGEHWGLSID